MAGIQYDQEWRKKEESIEEIIKKYPELPPIAILEIDAHRRGVFYTDAALERLDDSIHQVTEYKLRDGTFRKVPASLTLRDGSHLVVSEDTTKTARDPYLVDVVDNKIVLVDQGKVYEEVSFWEKPKFFDKFTSRGTPMKNVIQARPQRYSLQPSKFCHFWECAKDGCKYCSIGSSGVKYHGKPDDLINLQDVERAC